MHNVAIITNMYIYANRHVAMTLVGLIKKRAVVCCSVRNKASNHPDDGHTENMNTIMCMGQKDSAWFIWGK